MRQRIVLAMVLALAAACTSAAHSAQRQRAAVHPTPDDHFRVVSAARVGARTVVMVADRGCPTCWRVYRSGDAGRTWASHAVPTGDLESAVIAFADPRRGWVLRRTENPRHAVLFATTDGGRRWKPSPIRGGTALAAVNGYGYLLSNGRLYVEGPLDDHFAVLERSSADSLTVSDGAVLAYRSVPRISKQPRFDLLHGTGITTGRLPCGVTWSQAVAVQAAGVVALCGSEPGAGNQRKTAFLSADGGRRWRRTHAPLDGGYVLMAAAAGARVFFTGARMSLLSSSDRGAHWRTGIPGSGTGGGMWGLGFVDDTHGWVVDGGPPSALYLTDDGGQTWRTAARP